MRTVTCANDGMRQPDDLVTHERPERETVSIRAHGEHRQGAATPVASTKGPTVRSMISRPTGRSRLLASSLLIALPLSLGAAACSQDEPVEGGVVEEEEGGEEEED